MTVVYMNEEQWRAEALRMAISTAINGETQENIVRRAGIYFDFIMNGGTTKPE